MVVDRSILLQKKQRLVSGLRLCFSCLEKASHGNFFVDDDDDDGINKRRARRGKVARWIDRGDGIFDRRSKQIHCTSLDPPDGMDDNLPTNQ